jgi:hypothetical protein
MSRRRIMSCKPAKPRPGKRETPERGTASTRVSVTDLQKQLERQALENVRLSDEFKGALDHQRASAEILKVISTGRP